MDQIRDDLMASPRDTSRALPWRRGFSRQCGVIRCPVGAYGDPIKVKPLIPPAQVRILPGLVLLGWVTTRGLPFRYAVSCCLKSTCPVINRMDGFPKIIFVF